MTDDRFDTRLRALIARDANQIPGAPSQDDMVARLALALGAHGDSRPLPGSGTRGPASSLRVILVLAVLVALIVGAIAAGDRLINQTLLAVAPSAPATSAPATGAPPLHTAFALTYPPACAGSTRLADIRDTDVLGNTAPNWVAAPPPGAPTEAGTAQIAVFVWGEDGATSRAIDLLDPTDGSTCQLVELPYAYDVVDMSWAPSGDALAISARVPDSNTGMILVWSAVGITQVDANYSGEVAWAPNGSALAVEWYDVEIVHPDGSPHQPVLCEIKPGATPVIRGDFPPGGLFCPAPDSFSWSPDSTRIALSLGDRFGPPLFDIASVSDRQMHRLETGISGDVPIEGWLDDRTLLASDSSTLLGVPIDNPRAYRVIGPVPGAGSADSDPSPDLRTMAFTTFQPGGDLFATDILTGATSTVVDVAKLGKGLGIYRFEWAPNSRSLVFTLSKDRFAQADDGTDLRSVLPGVWIVNRDGTGLRQISTIQVQPTWPALLAARPAWR